MPDHPATTAPGARNGARIVANVNKWSTIPSSNATSDGNLWSEGQTSASVNNSARNNMAAVAAYRDDIAGQLTSSGSGTAFTVTTNSSNTDTQTLRRGFRACLKFHTTNTSSVPTLAIDGGTAKTITKKGGGVLIASDLSSGSFYDLVYNGTSYEIVSAIGAVSNIQVSDFAADAIVLEAEGIDSSDNDTSIPTSAAVKDYDKQPFIVACSDELSDLSSGAAKVTLRLPFAITGTEVQASVNTAPTSGGIVVDINKNSSTILSTKLTIDATEETSLTAASSAVISDTTWTSSDEFTIDIDQVGSSTPGKGLKVTMIGKRA